MKKKKQLEKIASEVDFIDENGGHHFIHYSSKHMNDFCPNLYDCNKPNKEYEWSCFGRYKACKYYGAKVGQNRNI